MKSIKISLFFLLLVHIGNLYAQSVYKGIDKNGRVLFSDKPFENSEKVEITPLPSYSEPPLNTSLENPTHKQEKINYQLQILQPNNDETFSTTVQNIVVRLSLTPELQKEDEIVILLNGVPHGQPSRNLSVDLGRLDRGAYDLVAQVVNKNLPNAPLVQSKKVTFFQQRAHIPQ